MGKRKYLVEDSELLQRSRTIRKHFLDNLVAFTNFDADLNATAAANWLQAIENCEAHPTDETLNDELRGKTDDVKQASREVFKAVNGLEYYVKKAFPDDELILREFGFTERQKVRAQAIGTAVWLLVMVKIATDYNTELTGVGMPAQIITDIETSGDTLAGNEVKQEIFKRRMISELRLRILKFNALYSLFITVHRAAQTVFSNDAEKRALFNLT